MAVINAMATTATTILMTDLPSELFPSPPLIARRALFAEGHNPLTRVFTDPRLALQIGFERELGLQVVPFADPRGFLDQAIGHSRTGRETARTGRNLVAEQRVIEHLVDEPHT